MKVTKNQLRSIIREAVRRKLDLGPLDEMPVSEPLKIDGPIITMESLQQLVDEEYALAVMLREDADMIPGMTMGNKPKAPPPPPHARGSTPQALRKKSAPGEQLRQFKSSVNMMLNVANQASQSGVREALPLLDKVIKFAQEAKEAVKQ